MSLHPSLRVARDALGTSPSAPILLCLHSRSWATAHSHPPQAGLWVPARLLGLPAREGHLGSKNETEAISLSLLMFSWLVRLENFQDGPPCYLSVFLLLSFQYERQEQGGAGGRGGAGFLVLDPRPCPAPLGAPALCPWGGPGTSVLGGGGRFWHPPRLLNKSLSLSV